MELLVKVGSTGSSQLQYQDGDIVEAYSQSQIELSHAYRLCHNKTVDLDSVSGLRPVNSLPYLFAEVASKYKFERISQTEVRRTNYVTGELDTIGPTPNANGERINVSLYISRRTSRSSHGIYGSSSLTSEPQDESSEPQFLAKRKFFVPYWDILSQLDIDVDDVRNSSKPVDARSEAPLSERSHLDDVHADKVTQGIIIL